MASHPAPLRPLDIDRRRLLQQLLDGGRRLADTGLVRARSGNISVRFGDGLLITTAGARLGSLLPGDVIAVERLGERPPHASSETATHAAVYAARPDVAAVVHTHSPYATAWAARGESIPCVITAMADEFGGEIPVGPFALIGGDDIGKGIVATLSGHRSPAVLMRNHGVFTIGPTAKAAVKAAVMCEDVARTVHLARAGGDVVPIKGEDIDALYARYQTAYGQEVVP
jgi:L-ribulose-5-phosphate 4-epimerase